MKENQKATYFFSILLLLMSLPAFAGTIQYTYDDLNRLTRVEYENGTTIEYSYDEVGNRLSKVVANGSSCETGDINCDDLINIFDLQLVINCILGSGSCERCDLNDDVLYNIFDLQLVINLILGS